MESNFFVMRANEIGDQVKTFFAENKDTLNKIVDTICNAFNDNKKLLLFGNGGSAADAQHIAAEFVNKLTLVRAPLPAIALTTDTSIITSIGNDISYNDIFSRQIEALGQPGDIAIGLSTSGKSPNVIRAFEKAHDMHLTTIGFTGGTGGCMLDKCDICLCPSFSSQSFRVQEIHEIAYHLIIERIERKLFK